jgi:hypothetical protein|eukprot:COSAG06_NODE_18636_length_847_cov_1.153153_2_plen_104_part_00
MTGQIYRVADFRFCVVVLCWKAYLVLAEVVASFHDSVGDIPGSILKLNPERFRFRRELFFHCTRAQRKSVSVSSLSSLDYAPNPIQEQTAGTCRNRSAVHTGR